MKKMQWMLAILLAVFLLISGCAAEKSNISFDVSALADALVAEGGFSDELVQLQPSAISSLWQLSADEIVAYAGGGGTSEEFVILKAADAASAAKAIQTLTSYRDERAALFAGYNAGEVPKLQNAILMTAGDYAIYCVSADASVAKSVIDRFTAAK